MSDKETNTSDEFSMAMIEELGEQLLPKLLPKLKPVFKKLSEFLGDDDKVLMLKKQKGDEGMYLCIINSDKLDMSIEGDGMQVFEIDQFLDLLINTDLETLIEKFE